jgi:hypothetical protein
MRKMKHGTDCVEVREHVITKNLWEHYITTRYPESSRIQEAVVVGFEVELGDIDMEEVSPFIITRTKDLETIMPAIGWDWGCE